MYLGVRAVRTKHYRLGVSNNRNVLPHSLEVRSPRPRYLQSWFLQGPVSENPFPDSPLASGGLLTIVPWPVEASPQSLPSP